jgi:hypothetical protein
MNEAMIMASLLRDFLVEANAVDSGAVYQIIVTDIAGNSVELKWHDKRWVLADRVNLARLLDRLRQEGSA